MESFCSVKLLFPSFSELRYNSYKKKQSVFKENNVVIQLDTKTVYSFMDSLIPIKKYVQKAKELGYSHLGMMDVDNLYGA